MRIGRSFNSPALVIAVLACALAAVACGASAARPSTGGSTASSEVSAAPAASVPTWGDATALKIATDAAKGKYITDAAGRAVYTYDKDSTMPACNGDCAATWPPVIAGTTAPFGVAGLDKPIRTSERADSTFQVTYGGTWLYYYSADVAAGDTKGDGVGGVWHLAKP